MTPEHRAARDDATRELEEVLNRRAVDLLGPALDGALVSGWVLALTYVDADGSASVTAASGPSTMTTHALGLLRWAQVTIEHEAVVDG